MAYISDRTGKRAPLLNSPFLSFIGFIITIESGKLGATYVGVVITASGDSFQLQDLSLGIYPQFPFMVCWLANSFTASYKRATGKSRYTRRARYKGGFAE